MAGAGGGQEPPIGDPMAGAGGAMSDAGASDAAEPDPGEIPEPVSEATTWGFGLGVTDVPAAVAFYTDVMKMTVEQEVTRGDRTDTVLYATEADRGARLILMHWSDGRETRKITAKLVWAERA